MSTHGPYTKTILKNELEKLLENNSIKSISEHFKCSIYTIYDMIKKFNLDFKSNKIKKYIGKKFGKLEVIEFSGKNKYRNTYLCMCDCGRTVIVDSCALSTNNTTSCGCSSRKRGKEHKNYQGYEDIPKSMFNRIKIGATERNLEFSITIEDIWNKYIEQDRKCSLTGLDLNIGQTNRRRRDGETTASLDRIDSSKGYTIDNIQWVHKDINWMKQNYPQKYFIEMCKKVVDYIKE